MAATPVLGDCQWELEGGAVSAAGRRGAAYVEVSTTGQERWYAVQTRSKHEKSVAKLLQARGICSYLPLASEVHSWSDRQKTVQVPLFSGYVFIRAANTSEAISQVVRTEGVVSILGSGMRGTPIPDEEIDSIQRMLDQKIPYRNHAFLDIGQRVRICGGALDGVEGILLQQRNESSLVISVEMMQRSLAMRIDGLRIEAI